MRTGDWVPYFINNWRTTTAENAPRPWHVISWAYTNGLLRPYSVTRSGAITFDSVGVKTSFSVSGLMPSPLIFIQGDIITTYSPIRIDSGKPTFVMFTKKPPADPFFEREFITNKNETRLIRKAMMYSKDGEWIAAGLAIGELIGSSASGVVMPNMKELQYFFKE